MNPLAHFYVALKTFLKLLIFKPAPGFGSNNINTFDNYIKTYATFTCKTYAKFIVPSANAAQDPLLIWITLVSNLK